MKWKITMNPFVFKYFNSKVDDDNSTDSYEYKRTYVEMRVLYG